MRKNGDKRKHYEPRAAVGIHFKGTINESIRALAM